MIYLTLKIIGLICIISLLIYGVKFFIKLLFYKFGKPLNICEKRVKKEEYYNGEMWYYPYVIIKYRWLGLHLFFYRVFSYRILHFYSCDNCVISKFKDFNKAKNVLNDEVNHLFNSYNRKKLKNKENINLK